MGIYVDSEIVKVQVTGIFLVSTIFICLNCYILQLYYYVGDQWEHERPCAESFVGYAMQIKRWISLPTFPTASAAFRISTSMSSLCDYPSPMALSCMYSFITPYQVAACLPIFLLFSGE